MDNGWIKLHRAIQSNPIWNSEPFSRGQAFVDLLLLANHKDSFFYKRGNKVIVKRGQVGRSEVELSDRWKWSRTKVRKFLKDLEKEQQIIIHKSRVTQLVTIVNYDNYQEKEQRKNNRKTTEEQQKDTYKNEKKEKKESNIIDFEYCIDCDSRSEDFRNTSFGIKDAQQTLQNIYEPKGWLIDKVKELTEEDRSQEWCDNVLHDFATTGITNYHSRITCPNKLNDKFCNWIKNAIKFEQENEAKAKKENKSLSMNDHLKANMIPKNYNYIKRKGKLEEYIEDFKNYEFKYNNIAKAYKNKSITAPLIYEIAHTSLGRGLHGTTELKKIDSLKAFVSNLSDYNQSQGDIRKLIQEHSKKTDL